MNKCIKSLLLAPNKEYVLKIVELIIDCHITDENIIATILHEVNKSLIADDKIWNIVEECQSGRYDNLSYSAKIILLAKSYFDNNTYYYKFYGDNYTLDNKVRNKYL